MSNTRILVHSLLYFVFMYLLLSWYEAPMLLKIKTSREILQEPETLECKDTHKDHAWHKPEGHCINDRVERALKILQ